MLVRSARLPVNKEGERLAATPERRRHCNICREDDDAGDDQLNELVGFRFASTKSTPKKIR